MCDCICKIEKDEEGNFAKILKNNEGLTVTKMDLKEVIFVHINGTFKAKTGSTLEIETEERKRPIKKSILHTYCPFCGQKYEQSQQEVGDLNKADDQRATEEASA